ncbi:MAG: SAM-dependent methyltransferase [Ketobacteraceae bacterium]|nr:SAM-dependent methyltransferase [Ketobacteraceae bacterium]
MKVDLQRDRDESIGSADTFTVMRALMAKEDDLKIRNPDYLAEKFVQGKWERALKMPNMLRYLCDKKYPGAYCYALARTKHIDNILQSELDSGLEQVLILGAGNDSRFMRFSKQLGGCQLFELDFPGTQARKLEVIRDREIGDVRHIRYIPIDFENDSISEKLLSHGYSSDKKTLVIWEGVTFYLNIEAVNEVLNFFSSQMGDGSSIVFDYALSDFIDGNYEYFGSLESALWSEKAGEPYAFGMSPQQLNDLACSLGFVIKDDIGPEEMKHQYLKGSDGAVIGDPIGCFRFAHFGKDE